MVQALDKLDLTNAQKRDKRFYPQDAVIVFNQKVRQAEPGMRGKLTAIRECGIFVEINGKDVLVSNKVLDKITVCLPREIPVAQGDKLHLKANRKLASGARVTNGELVAVKSVHANGNIELTDGRVLDKTFREFLARLCRHVLRFTGQDSGLRSVFRFHHQGRDQRATMVCHHFARAARRPHIHAGQGTIAGESGAFRPQAVGVGICRRPAPTQSQSALGPAAWPSSAVWPTCRRYVLPIETIPPSFSTRTKT